MWKMRSADYRILLSIGHYVIRFFYLDLGGRAVLNFQFNSIVQL